jgi:hypothetical protein
MGTMHMGEKHLPLLVAKGDFWCMGSVEPSGRGFVYPDGYCPQEVASHD